MELTDKFLSLQEDKMKEPADESERAIDNRVPEEDPNLFTMNVDNFLRSSVRRQCKDSEEVQSSFV